MRTLFEPSSIVTLLSDFGSRDGYVGAMKGVILSVDPTLRLVDLAHHVPPQDVVGGALTLRAAAPWFPRGTVHLAVVDPGVGTERAPIALFADGHAFVGPDNGLFDLVAEAMGGIDACFRIEGHPLLPATASLTFHGRDIFAPTAAGLASGRLAPADTGPPMDSLGLEMPEPLQLNDGRVVGEVIQVDHFGNLVTNLEAETLAAMGTTAQLRVDVAGRTIRLAASYGAAPVGHVVCVINSEGCLEIALRDGSAATHLDLHVGIPVTVRAEHGSDPR